MSAIHDLINQIGDPRLRERLATEWAQASQNKKFGLVFEDHLPELLPLHQARPRKGDLVCRRQGALKEVWQVKSVKDGVVICVKPKDNAHPSEPIRSAAEPVSFAVDEVLVVREFGEPIFPSLVPVDAVANGPADAPWHTLIEADNYHALQLLDYLYAGKVDCIYIDPPYNTGARDWKYNNDYVDGNDSWRHSKWLAFMEKRLKLAKKLLKPDTGVLIVTIDEHEVHHLGMLLERDFPEAYRQLVTIVINPKGVTQGRFSRVEEYACAPQGKIYKYDVSIAKNYLSEFELAQMQRIVSAYLDMAEVQAMRRFPMTMQDWEERLGGFIKLWDREILQDAGKVTAEIAKAHAESEFEKYRIVQDRLFENDFDRLIRQVESGSESDSSSE